MKSPFEADSVQSRTGARYGVDYNGVRYDDIDWSKPIHSLGERCPRCGCDGAEGHGSSCEYLWSSMDSPRGRDFLREMIREALEREKPIRIQLSRRKGWRMPANTVVVSRPGPFGNPWSVSFAAEWLDISRGQAQQQVVDWFRQWITHPTSDDPCDSTGLGGHLKEHTRILARLPTLRGKNLACWCPLLDKYGRKVPCHADVLLELANAPICEKVKP